MNHWGLSQHFYTRAQHQLSEVFGLFRAQPAERSPIISTRKSRPSSLKQKQAGLSGNLSISRPPYRLQYLSCDVYTQRGNHITGLHMLYMGHGRFHRSRLAPNISKFTSAKAALVDTHFVFCLYCKSSLHLTFIFLRVSRQSLVRSVSTISPPQLRLGCLTSCRRLARGLYVTLPDR